MTAHKHAALMLQYAQDAAQTDEPWLLWQTKAGGNWVTLAQSPMWAPTCDYRRRPRAIRIGEFDVPEPLRVAPPLKTRYFTISPLSVNGVGQGVGKGYTWSDDEWDRRALNAGCVHLSYEAAEQHARALLAFTK